MANPHAGLIPYPSPTIGIIVPKMKGRADLSGEMSEIVGTPQLPSIETKACDVSGRLSLGKSSRACLVLTALRLTVLPPRFANSGKLILEWYSDVIRC